jgi:ABC-type dipeptide/oligopeptide/nickel transport system ATPase component
VKTFALSRRGACATRGGRVSTIFQVPMPGLNPVFAVGTPAARVALRPVCPAAYWRRSP